MARQGCEKHGHINCSACADDAELTRLRADVARLTQERDGWKRAAESQNRQWSRACEERTEYRARAEQAEAERDAALAEVERLRTQLDDAAAWLSGRGYAFESLGLLLAASNAKIAFGLRQQGKYERVADMRAKGESWESIGEAIGWSADAVERHFTLEADAALAPEQEAG